jgi:hypothetical protein
MDISKSEISKRAVIEKNGPPKNISEQETMKLAIHNHENWNWSKKRAYTWAGFGRTQFDK